MMLGTMTDPTLSKRKKTSDWADLLALKIMADAHSYSFDEATSLSVRLKSSGVIGISCVSREAV
jgi:hypothetical protein